MHIHDENKLRPLVYLLQSFISYLGVQTFHFEREPDEGYSWSTSCVLHLIYTCLLYRHEKEMKKPG